MLLSIIQINLLLLKYAKVFNLKKSSLLRWCRNLGSELESETVPISGFKNNIRHDLGFIDNRNINIFLHGDQTLIHLLRQLSKSIALPQIACVVGYEIY